MDIDDVDMKEIEEDQTTQRKYWTLESKVKVLDYMDDKKVSPYKTSEHFDHKYWADAIYKWQKNADKIRNTLGYKPKIHTLHPGKKPDLTEIEEKLLEFIALNLDDKNPVTIWTIITYCDKIFPEKSKDSFNTKYIRIYRFVKKHGFYSEKTKKRRVFIS